MNRYTRKVTFAIAGVILFLALAAILFTSRLNPIPVSFSPSQNLFNELRTLSTLKKVDGWPLYVMHYYGDYGFQELLKAGLPNNQNTTSQSQEDFPSWACSCFAAHGKGGDAQFGRNFDWYEHPALLLFTHPSDGYDSVSMVDIDSFGIGKVKLPSWRERFSLLSTPYAPFDGMNEYGLAVGMMAVPNADAPIDAKKISIGPLHLIRLWLDHARNVDEALALLQKYNVDTRYSQPPIHYLVSDASGSSAVVEFVAGNTKLERNQESWQVATNFLLSGLKPAAATAHCSRYKKAYEQLSRTNGQMSSTEAMAVLKSVSQDNTIWSINYNMSSGDILLAMGKHYNQVYHFKQPMAGK